MTQGRLVAASAILSLFALTAHAKQFPAVPGEYVVKIRNVSKVMSTKSVTESLGAKVERVINGKENLFLVKRPMIETQESAVKSLSASPFVVYAEPNYIYRVVGTRNMPYGNAVIPTDSEFGKLWGMQNTGQPADGDGGSIMGKPGVDINATQAWGITTGSKDVIVAVIDTGVNYNNPDLAANIYTNEAELNGQPGVDDDANGCVDDIHGCDFSNDKAIDGDPMDVYGHGTHVSGTIGATADGQGVVGVAWNVKILPVRFLGDDGGGTLEGAVKAIDYATAMHANIMSNSWGGGGFSQALQDAIVRAKDAGILFVAAAGNSSNDNDSNPEYPCGYQVDNVISVAAIDPRGMLADFSNYGKSTVHIAAPGVNIMSYTMAGLESWSGTSMATPHVSGVAALLLSQDMTQSYATIKARLLASARPLPKLRGRVQTGLVNAYYALTNQAAPIDPEDPFNWLKSADTVSTDHPYKDKTKVSYTFTVPGARRIAAYFTNFETESGYDKVTFTDAAGKSFGEMSGKLGETFGPVVDGDTVIITFTSDDSVTTYGFDLGGIAYQN